MLAFVERWLYKLWDKAAFRRNRLSRSGFFLSSLQNCAQEILLKDGLPVAFADLGSGVLDAALVETAAYCLERNTSQANNIVS